MLNISRVFANDRMSNSIKISLITIKKCCVLKLRKKMKNSEFIVNIPKVIFMFLVTHNRKLLFWNSVNF